MTVKILIGSPIHQKPDILALFLQSLQRLNTDKLKLSYVFIDDNTDEASRDLLKEFAQQNKDVEILPSTSHDVYVTNDYTHQWTYDLVWKVANFKNAMIQYFLARDDDYLFFIDSDILIDPHTLTHLVTTKKDIISEIFWTKWTPGSVALPQVWYSDLYTQIKLAPNESLAHLSAEEVANRHQAFLDEMQTPGVYEVGGLGACTLIKRNVLEAGVNFSKISNVSFWGEDRHFCIRANVLGFPLHVDTHLPAYHIYRSSDMAGALQFLKDTE